MKTENEKLLFMKYVEKRESGLFPEQAISAMLDDYASLILDNVAKTNGIYNAIHKSTT